MLLTPPRESGKDGTVVVVLATHGTTGVPIADKESIMSSRDEQAPKAVDAGRVWATEKAGKGLRLSPAEACGLARLLRAPNVDWTGVMEGRHDLND